VDSRSDVKRYELVPFVNRGGTADAKMLTHPEGEWVKHEDYDRLRKGVEYLKTEAEHGCLDDMYSDLCDLLEGADIA
jgi:hypothetical protein